MKTRFILIILCFTVVSCTAIDSIENPAISASDSTISANDKNNSVLTKPTQIAAAKTNSARKKPAAVINFVGSVTLKKANDLTSYIHKQMVEGVKDFTINISSSGGDTDAGISAYQYLKALPISITTHNTSNVQSAAALIYCVGQKRYSLPHSFFMLHGNSTTYQGGMSLLNIESLYKLNKIRLKAFTDIFKNCTQFDLATAEGYFSSSVAVYFNAEEAKTIGLVKEIGSPRFADDVSIYNIAD